jgi:kinesin family protein 11
MRLSTLLEDEKRSQALERHALLSQITALIDATAEKQHLRVEQGITSVQTELGEHGAAHGQVHETFVTEGHQWSERSQAIVSKAMKSRETVKTKIKSDFAVSLFTAKISVHH